MVTFFDKLKKIFNENGFRLYMVGGTSRDYLLNLEIKDFDFVTDALPEETLKFLKCDDVFKKFGVLIYKEDKIRCEIVTFRKEEGYEDFRHPQKIIFVKSIEEDYVRRDFTINSLYIDENYNVIDPTNMGVKDLNDKILRFIGDPIKRIKEDPLRILRAERFVKKYNLKIEENSLKAIKENYNLINKLKIEKVEEEKRKGKL